jgi:MFS family permease
MHVIGASPRGQAMVVCGAEHPAMQGPPPTGSQSDTGSAKCEARGMPRGFHLVIAAQFVSALADNALLIVAIALLVEQSLPPWWAPMLKFGFTVSYVALAPFVGVLADAVPKARLMAWMNGVKVLGVLALLGGAHPVAGFALVGLGAAAYAPAKYGLITELVPARQLVAANGWIEVSVVCAALLGTVLGGALVGTAFGGSSMAQAITGVLRPASAGAVSSAHAAALAALLAAYALASLLNVGIPDSGARYPRTAPHPLALCRDFAAANRTLWRDRDGGLSLAVTTIFWGVGATLQFAVLRWAGEVLQLSLDRAAYLQAAVAVGVVAGAAAAGRWVPLAAARRMLPVGIVLGLLMPVVASVDRVGPAVAVLALAGAVGGLLVVPLNALLQHRGCTVLTAGRSIAVQGFNENASVLAMLAVYGALVAAEVPIVPLLWGFGLLIALAMAALIRLADRPLRPPNPAGP